MNVINLFMKKILIILFVLLNSSVHAFEKKTNFSFEKFEKAKSDGKTIVVNSWNKYCSTCNAQTKIFDQAINDFKNVEFLFYEQTKYADIAKTLNIKFWTTIVVFKGEEQVAKKVGLTSKEEIYKLIKKGI
tara:strand:- start:38 stop:430 length:393 start_codon:yes stop_codon:yes gene_type:complete